MPITLPDLIAMRQRIETDFKRAADDLKRLEEELAAVKTLEKRLRAENAGQQPALNLVNQNQPASFAEAVRQTVPDFKDQEFTVANVENSLVAKGTTLPKNARARIAIELSGLVKKQVLTLTHRGVGSAPHRFRLLRNSEEPEKSEGTSVRALVPSVTTSPDRGQPMLAARPAERR